jgi:hypothetical protein
MQTDKKTRKTSELQKVKQLIRLCQKNSISRIKYDNLEIEFSFAAKKSTGGLKYEKEDARYLEAPQVDMPPDDVMMFAATSEFDSLIETRKSGRKK